MSPYRRYRAWGPRRHWTRTTAHLGSRGTVLALLGVTWIIIGGVTLVTPPPPPTSYYLLSIITVPRGILWIVTGLIAIAAAAKPQGDDAVGFLALYVMAAWRVVAYAAGFVLWALPGGAPGDPRGILNATTWIVIVALIVKIAGWPEPDEGRPR